MTSTRFHPPQQHRSRATLDRILDAAEEVLSEKSFTEATLAEIVDRAGLTVGAFYRRFPDKDALLHHLDERYFTEMHDRANVLLDPARWTGQPLSAVFDALAREGVVLYSARRGLLRSLFLRARTDRVLQVSARRVNGHFIARLQALLGPRRDELSHPDVAAAVPLAFRMFVGALRETVVFAEVWPSEASPASDEVLAKELARLLSSYLGA